PRCCRAIYHTYTHPLSLHDALPISIKAKKRARAVPGRATQPCRLEHVRDKVEISSRGFLQPPALSFGESPPDTDAFIMLQRILQDRKSTRLNSTHVSISYAVFCLKK